jgi:hypothetical protein
MILLVGSVVVMALNVVFQGFDQFGDASLHGHPKPAVDVGE